MNIHPIPRSVSRFFWTLTFLTLSLGPRLFADGFIIPNHRPNEIVLPLTVKYHHVQVEIINQVARTSIDEVFINNHDRDIEGTFIFPLPEGASISEFAMFIGDQKVQGEVLDAGQARRIYEDIVRRLRDPALLEYIGRNMFRARVFPIPAKGEKRIQLSYTEVLKSEKNLVKYLYPLNTEKFSYQPIQDVTISVRIESKIPIANVYSPSHKISLRRDGQNRVAVGFEERNVKPDKDFVAYYSLTPDEVGMSFINFDEGADRYFMLLASPRYSAEREKIINKNLVLVLDSSGSMSGRKIGQAKEAARFIINHLAEGDRFSVIDFDDGVRPFAEEMEAADSRSRERALNFIDAIEDSGGTNLNEALLQALRLIPRSDRPNYVLFLTDGQPTVGSTDTADIRKNVSGANIAGARLFVFGLGNDVNTELLDILSSDNRGTSVYVGENEDLEVALSSYYEKISSPLLSDLAMSFKGIEVRDVYPRALPDLFKGSQLVVLGKYTGNGPVTVVLSGQVGKTKKKFVLETGRLAHDRLFQFLPRLWATRRVGYLLEEIRLKGQVKELVDEIRKLGLKHGIVTPYTSFLVTEKERRLLDAAAPAAQEALDARQVTGAGAVRLAKATAAFKDEDRAAETVSEQIRYRQDKIFYLKEDFWVDSIYTEKTAVKEIKFNSDDYFKLITDKPGLAIYLSVGPKLIISYQGVNYKIVD